MKQINLAWFLLYTGWAAIISNGWWVIATQNLEQRTGVLISIGIFVLSVVYIIVLGCKFIDALDKE